MRPAGPMNRDDEAIPQSLVLGGVRIGWEGIPERVLALVESWLGSRIVSSLSQPGGFSPGVAARIRTEDGRRVFVKAIGPEPNPESPEFHRREIRIASALPESVPAPRLLWSYDEGDGGWVALLFEDVEGRNPALPWLPADLNRVLDALAVLSDLLTPSPLPAGVVESASKWSVVNGRYWELARELPPERLDDWSRRHLRDLARLEAEAAPSVAGDTLLHLDIRADNLIITPERVLIVDWPSARVGAAWLDVVFFAPSVAMQGGPHPEELIARHPVTGRAAPGAITAAIAAIAGFFTWNSLQPDPAGLPTLRAFQASQGVVARRWLAHRAGWA